MLRTYTRSISLLILLAVFAVKGASSVDDGHHEYPAGFRPLVMLTEFNPWAMVVGSDSPTFVLYENGTVIFLKDGKYNSAKLTPAEVDSFLVRLGRDSLGGLKDSYTLSEHTDLPTNVLVVRIDGSHYRKISIYGTIRDSKSEPVEALPLPDELARALRLVLKYDNANSSAWMPEYFEVMIWPFEYAKGNCAEWPAKWPGLSDPKTLKHKDMYSIFVAESQYQELEKFVSQLKPTEAVRIDNKKWAVSVRFPFPHER